MSSILNSISSGDLQVSQVPRETPIKEDSIIDLLQNSEIEFKTCPDIVNNIDNFNTGFGKNNDLHYNIHCQDVKTKTPLYQENFLSEFFTEEDKAAARHSLGLYNKQDVVAMSLLTTDDDKPTTQDWVKASVKQMKKGDIFFTPYTTFKAVHDSSGVNLETRIKEVNLLIQTNTNKLNDLTKVSKNEEITSLGDVKLFLKGFTNGENLYNTIDCMNQEMLRFEKTRKIKN